MSTPPDLGPLPEPESMADEGGRAWPVAVLRDWPERNRQRYTSPRFTATQIEAERQRCYMLGVAAERERCAKLCESIRELDNENAFEAAADRCAEAIRATPSAPTKEGG